MYLILVISCILAAAYLLLGVGISVLWKKQEHLVIGDSPLPTISIVIIVRNEAASIASCLRAIAANDYPVEKYEIIIIDDHSDDETVEVVRKLSLPRVRLYHLSEFDLSSYQGRFKKAGQHYGVLLARHDLILQTDGDCICGPSWILTMSNQMQENDFVTGPVLVTHSHSFLSRWQTYENIAVMAASYAGIRMGKWYNANGGNMIFKKELFLQYKQEGIEKYASGDDLFLVNWANSKGLKIGFAKTPYAIIRTPAEDTIQGFFDQRLRWATKTKGYKSAGIQWIMAGLFLWHLLIIGLIIYAILHPVIGGFLFIIVFATKCIGDYLVIHGAAPFFRLSFSMWMAPVFSLCHLFYVAFFGICGLFKSRYNWKGRSVK